MTIKIILNKRNFYYNDNKISNAEHEQKKEQKSLQL